MIGSERPHMIDALQGFVHGSRSYLVVTAVFGLIVAVLDSTALAIMGVPLVVLWGLLAFITKFGNRPSPRTGHPAGRFLHRHLGPAAGPRAGQHRARGHPPALGPRRSGGPPGVCGWPNVVVRLIIDPIFPPVIMSMAITSVYRVMAVWMPVMVVPTSAATVAIAVRA